MGENSEMDKFLSFTVFFKLVNHTAAAVYVRSLNILNITGILTG